jgi:Flagellar biosynthesis protein, FliO
METLQPYMQYIYALGGVLVLAVLAIILLRVFGRSVRGRRGTRLSISEYYEIDKSRRLVLVRRDELEHLILIGGNQDVVIESNIGSPLVATSAPAPSNVIRQAPRPAIFTGRRPTLRPVENLDQRNTREEPQM